MASESGEGEDLCGRGLHLSSLHRKEDGSEVYADADDVGG